MPVREGWDLTLGVVEGGWVGPVGVCNRAHGQMCHRALARAATLVPFCHIHVEVLCFPVMHVILVMNFEESTKGFLNAVA